MKLYSNRLEMQTIYCICEATKYSALLMASLSVDHFYSDYGKELYSFIRKATKIDGEIPKLKDLATNPKISEDARRGISKFKGEVVSNRKTVSKLITNLHHYYQMRKLYFLSENINEKLLNSKVDVDALVSKVGQEISKISAKLDTDQQIYSFGSNGSIKTVISSLLDDEKPEMLPTGFDAFDSINGGFFYGSLVLIGGTTGGGKCIVGNSKVSLADNNKEEIKNIWDKTDSPEIPYENGHVKLLFPNIKLKKHDGTIGLASHMFKTSGKTIRITLEDGRNLEGLPEHKVKIQVNGEMFFKRLDELSLDDDVVIEE